MLTMTGFGWSINWDWFQNAFDAAFFRCANGACYGLKQVESEGWNLQAALNRFVSLTGQKPIAVDGWVGAETMRAAYSVGHKISDKLDGNVFDLFINNTDPLVLIRNTPSVIAALNTAAEALGLPKAVPFTIPSGAKKAKTPPPVTSPSSTDTGTSIWWYILGAVALAGVGTVGYIVYKRRKNRALSTERI